jgi:oligopeptide transport system substrate-binding protein
MCLFLSCSKINPSNSKTEQHLKVNLKKEPVSLDPRKGNDMVASQLHFMLFEGLLKLNPDLTLSPAQAKSYEVSDDRKTYIFHLRDTTWSDGTPVTAYDFEKSWKSILNPVFPCPDAYLLYTIKNAKFAKKGEVPLYQVGITSRDAKTLIVELEYPAPFFLQTVASSVFLPVNFQLDSKEPDWADSSKNFISNGPFVLKDWKLNQEIVLEKNGYYRQAEEVKLDRVSFEIIDNESTVLYLYSSGHFDLVGTPLSFIPSMIHHDAEKKKLLHFFPVATTKFLAFNTAIFPFNNANIRRAFSYAINRKDIVEHISQLGQQEALTVIPPALLPGQPNLFNDADDERAREFLKKGLQELQLQPKDLNSITFMYCSSAVNQSIAQELQNRWSKVLGVDINLENMEFKLLHDRSKKGEFSIGLFAWLADYSDPMNILERFQDKTSHRNYSKWQNDSYNLLLTQALKASSQNEYLQKIKEAEQLLVDEMPITGLYHDNYVFLIQPHVRNFAISPLGHIYFDRISLELH